MAVDTLFVEVGVPVAMGLVAHLAFNRLEPRDPVNAGAITLCAPLVVCAALAAVTTALRSPLLSPLPTLQFYLLYLSTLCLSVVLYRISPLHPLAGHAGPILRRVSKLPAVCAVWGGRQHVAVLELHRKYGPVVRVGPNELSIVDEDAMVAILGAGGLPKGQWYDAGKDPAAPQNLIGLTGPAHAHRRRLWNRGMGRTALAGYCSGALARRVAQLVERLKQAAEGGREVDISQWVTWYSFDFMGDMAFGGGFEMMRDGGDSAGIQGVMERFSFATSIVAQVPWASRALLLFSSFRRDVQAFQKFAMDMATRRLSAGVPEPGALDLWHHLSDEGGLEKERPAVQDVVADGVIAIIAGSDTVACALATAVWCLLRAPEAYAALEAEIDAAFPRGAAGAGGPVDAEKIAAMPYLNACIDETLRLYPPNPTNGPRATGADGAHIAGHYIPPHTQVFLPPFCYHRDARYFAAPDTFSPERWLARGGGGGGGGGARAAFMPFSHGPAGCAGRLVARAETGAALCALLGRFRVRFAPGFQGGGGARAWPETMRDHFMLTRPPLWVTLEPRADC